MICWHVNQRERQAYVDFDRYLHALLDMQEGYDS